MREDRRERKIWVTGNKKEMRETRDLGRKATSFIMILKVVVYFPALKLLKIRSLEKP